MKMAWLLVGVLALTFGACATTPEPSAAPPSVNVKGTWAGTWAFENAQEGTGDATLELDQTGPEVAGSATVTTRMGVKRTFLKGLVTGNTLILTPPYASGNFTVKGDEMVGVVQGIMAATVTLRRQK
jgi:hypothetical protein